MNLVSKMSQTRMSVSWYISLRKTRATTSCKVLKTLYRILAEMGCPWSWACNPRPPLIKVASNKRPCLKLGGTTLNEREEGGQYYISQTCDLRSDLKEERSFFRGSVSTVLQLRLYLFISFVPPGHFLLERFEKSSFYFPTWISENVFLNGKPSLWRLCGNERNNLGT